MSTSEALAPSSEDRYTGKNGVIIVNDISIKNALATKIVSVTTHGTRAPPSLDLFKDYALETGSFKHFTRTEKFPSLYLWILS